MSDQAIKDQHRISTEFIGTDTENEQGFQARFIVRCTCRGLDENVSLSGRNASIRIERHLRAHGITESFTQHAQSTERECLDCRGTGTRSWPQSRQTDPRRPLERERLDPQVTKCGACAGTGVIAG